MATGAAIISALAATAGTVVNYEQGKAQEKAQDKAIAAEKETALLSGPTATAVTQEDTSIEQLRKRLVRSGFYNNIKSQNTLNSLTGKNTLG